MKKYIFLFVVLVIGSFNAVTVNAQSSSCNPITTEAQFLSCCEYYYDAANKTACDNYKNSGADSPVLNPTTAYSCTTITDESTFLRCCEYYYDAANKTACDNYKNGGSGTGATTGDPTCKTITDEGAFLRCCEYYYQPAHQVACNAYKNPSSGTGQVGTGTLPTGANNGGTSGSGYNFKAPAGSAELQACAAINFKSVLDYLIWIKCVINSAIIPLIFALAFLFFLWNIFRFVQSSDKTNKEEAKTRMVWGLIALFVMLSVWGIIAILSKTLGITPSVPLLQTSPLDISNAN